jgi:hypothetical protein
MQHPDSCLRSVADSDSNIDQLVSYKHYGVGLAVERYRDGKLQKDHGLIDV